MYPNWTCLDCDAAEQRGGSSTMHQLETMHMIVPVEVRD